MHMKYRKSSKAFKPAYDSYQRSITLLKKGFEATKFNFSNKGHGNVRVYLSDDEQYLCYQHLEKSVRRPFNLVRKLPVTEIPNILYGGISSTFKKHNRRNLKQMEYYKLGRQHTQTSRSLNRNYSLRVRAAPCELARNVESSDIDECFKTCNDSNSSHEYIKDD